MEYFCCVLRRHLIKKFKDVGANALFNSFFGGQPIYLFLRIHSYLWLCGPCYLGSNNT